MNIFATSPDPAESAAWLDDKRLGKLLVEACQLISYALVELAGDSVKAPDMCMDVHPSSGYSRGGVALWTKAKRSNALWLLDHAEALAENYKTTYDKRHASFARLSNLRDLVMEYLPPDDGRFSTHHNSARNAGMNLDFTHLPVYEAYRLYLRARWTTDTRKVSFRNRQSPV